MTAFSQINMDRTNRAHLAAVEQFYPKLWPNAKRIEFIDKTGTVDDLSFGIDCIALVTVQGLRAPLKFGIQERFRNPCYMKWEDTTVTEWNKKTNLPSELYKMIAQLFIYGYYDERNNRIVDAMAINVAQMYQGIAAGTLPYTRQARGDNEQDFIGLRWQDLQDSEAIMHSTIDLSRKFETLTDLPGKAEAAPTEKTMKTFRIKPSRGVQMSFFDRGVR